MVNCSYFCVVAVIKKFQKRGFIMKSTGIVRRIDELGRIVLPIELRRTFDIEVKDAIEIYTDQDMIILKKFQRSCLFCGEAENAGQLKDNILVFISCDDRKQLGINAAEYYNKYFTRESFLKTLAAQLQAAISQHKR